MSAVPVPSDDELLAFLLGTLPTERGDMVRLWLDADPTHAARLDKLAPRDPLTTALADKTPLDSIPADTIERVIRRVSDALHKSPSTDDTPDLADHGGTVQQLRPPVAEFAPAWPPQRLGEYRVEREIGRGGMGVVLEVTDDTLHRRVAAKVLHPELARKPDATARFLREARAAAAIEHDNVVPILHVGVEAGAPYIVMPLLKGEALDKRLKREGALPVAEVVRIGREIAAGLGAAHAKGLVHRDMKPANVWLDAETGRARVLDFGLARMGDGTDALTESGAIQGTPAYMAPEQIDGLPAHVRIDLFALGAILYECATGRRAFPGATLTAILKSVSTHNPEPPVAVNPLVPQELSDLIVRLLAKTPADRPASASEVIAALSRVPLGEPAPVTATVTWTDRSAAPAPRSRRMLWLAGAGLFAALVGVGIWLAARPKHTEEVAKEYPVSKPEPHPADPPRKNDSEVTPRNVNTPAPVRYRGRIEVLVERMDGAKPRLVRLNETGALPLKQTDKFRIEGEVDPPAYLYVVWVDPERDVTPVFPWNATKGWGSRPTKEEPVGKVSLPPNVGNRYTAPAAKPGVATMVLFARPVPLDVPDDVVKEWFESLPDLPLPTGGDRAAVWFDNFVEVKDPSRLRTFGEVGSNDAFAQWQGKLQKAMGKVDFQTAVSFARTGRK